MGKVALNSWVEYHWIITSYYNWPAFILLSFQKQYCDFSLENWSQVVLSSNGTIKWSVTFLSQTGLTIWFKSGQSLLCRNLDVEQSDTKLLRLLHPGGTLNRYSIFFFYIDLWDCLVSDLFKTGCTIFL